MIKIRANGSGTCTELALVLRIGTEMEMGLSTVRSEKGKVNNKHQY